MTGGHGNIDWNSEDGRDPEITHHSYHMKAPEELLTELAYAEDIFVFMYSASDNWFLMARHFNTWS